MRRQDFLRWAGAAAISMLFAAQPSCRSNSLKQPTVQLQSVEPVFTDKQGFVARVHGTANNPNPVPLPIRRVDAEVNIAGRDIGDAKTASSTTLAPNADTDVTFDVIVPWSQVAFLATKTGMADEVPYTVTGKAWVGNDVAEFPFPFTQSGTISKSRLLAAGLSFVPIDLGSLRRQLNLNEGKP